MKAALILLFAGTAHANVSLALTPCAEAEAARRPLIHLLGIELGTPVVDGEANVRVKVDCGERHDLLDVVIERGYPAGSHRGSINLERLPNALRPRTIALAIAEDLRYLDEPPAPVETAPPPLATPAPVSSPQPQMIQPPVVAAVVESRTLRDPMRMRAARNWAIGLGVTSVVLTIIGAPILSSGTRYQPPDAGMIAGGAIVISLAGASLAGMGVSLGYFAIERMRPVD